MAHGTFRLFRENGLVPVVCGQGAGRLRTRAFVVARHVPIPLCPLGPLLIHSRPARAPREQRHLGRVPGKSAGGMPHGASHPSASSFFCSVSSFGARGGRVES